MIWIEETGCWFAGPDGKPERAQGIVRINNERHARDEQLMRFSRHDPLTGELNRTHLVAALAGTIEETMRLRSSSAFMLVGIDNLARINDAYGFDVADEVIGAVAKRIRGKMRGGDHARPLLRQQVRASSCKTARRTTWRYAAERLLAGVRDEVIRPTPGPVSVTVTIGGVTAPRHARDRAGGPRARAGDARRAPRRSGAARSRSIGRMSSATR